MSISGGYERVAAFFRVLCRGDCCASPAGFRACSPGLRSRPALSRHCLPSCALSACMAFPFSSRLHRLWSGFRRQFRLSDSSLLPPRLSPFFPGPYPVFFGPCPISANPCSRSLRSLSGRCPASARPVPDLCCRPGQPLPLSDARRTWSFRQPVRCCFGMGGAASGPMPDWLLPGALHRRPASGPVPDPAGQNLAGQKNSRPFPLKPEENRFSGTVREALFWKLHS